MNVNELKNEVYIIDWLDGLNGSPNTMRNYLLAMQYFTEWSQKTPEELILDAEEEIKAGILPRKRTIKKHFIGFRKHLQDKGLASTSVKTNVNGVKSFYKHNDIEIPSLPKAGTKAVTLEENKAIPTKEDLRAVLKVCDPLERALLLVGASSGLSRGDIIKLKVKDFKNGYDPKTEITTLTLRRTKTKVDFITFLTPEASRAVNDYLNYRERDVKNGEERRRPTVEKQKVYSIENFLFIGRSIPNSYLKTRDDRTRQIKENSLLQIYFNISEKAQKSTSKGHWNLIRSHNIRKFFNTTLKSAGCDNFHVEFWMGHQIDSSQLPYFLGNPEQEKELYSKYVPYLTIEKALDISESAEYQQIKRENQILATETARHVVERSELQDVRAELKQTKVEKEALATKMDGMKEEIREELSDELKEMTKKYIRFRRKIWRQNNPIINLDSDFEEQMDTKSIDEKLGSAPMK